MPVEAAEALTNKRLFVNVGVVCKPLPETTERIRQKELIIKRRI